MSDGAGVLEGAYAFDALLAADTGGLHAAEGGAQVEAGGAVVVHPDITANQLAANPVGRLGIGRPNRAAQTGPTIVRHTDGFRFSLEGDQRNLRAELLFGHDAQLEMASAVEYASPPFRVTEIPQLVNEIKKSWDDYHAAIAAKGFRANDASFFPFATLRSGEENLVDRDRARAQSRTRP